MTYVVAVVWLQMEGKKRERANLSHMFKLHYH